MREREYCDTRMNVFGDLVSLSVAFFLPVSDECCCSLLFFRISYMRVIQFKLFSQSGMFHLSFFFFEKKLESNFLIKNT